MIARHTETVVNVFSLLVVGVGIAVAASFFVGSPRHDAEAEVPAVEKASPANAQPKVPVAAGKIDRAIERLKARTHREEARRAEAKKKAVHRGPVRKML